MGCLAGWRTCSRKYTAMFPCAREQRQYNTSSNTSDRVQLRDTFYGEFRHYNKQSVLRPFFGWYNWWNANCRRNAPHLTLVAS
ncbi:hypothetical protein COOONC_26615 [Cooperia oncophora]